MDVISADMIFFTQKISYLFFRGANYNVIGRDAIQVDENGTATKTQDAV